MYLVHYLNQSSISNFVIHHSFNRLMIFFLKWTIYFMIFKVVNSLESVKWTISTIN